MLSTYVAKKKEPIDLQVTFLIPRLLCSIQAGL